MVKSLCMTLVYCPGLTCIQVGWQCHSLVDFQLGVKPDSISLTGICTESSKCDTGFCNSGSDLIIKVHCPGKSASQVGEFINTFSFCPFTVMVGSLYGFPGWCTTSGVQPLSFCDWCTTSGVKRLVYNLCLFVPIVRSYHSYRKTVRLDPRLFAFLPLSWHSYPYHLHRGAQLAHQSAP